MFRPLLLLALLAVFTALGRAQNVSIVTITRSPLLAVAAADFNLSTGSGSVTSTSVIRSQIRSTVRPWLLGVRATSANFLHTPLAGAPATNKAISNLLIRRNGASSFTTISTSDAVLTSGSSTTGGGVPVNLDLRFTTSLSDSPGSYAATLVFTIFTL